MKYKFYILPGKALLERQFATPNQVYLSSYKIFKKVWQDTFKELESRHFEMFSNEFTRQDRIHALFYDDVCIGLTCIRRVNLYNPVDLDDSWFKSWNPKYFEMLRKQNETEALVNSFFTVHPDFRKSLKKFPIHPSFLLGALSIMDQINTEENLMLGMMRTDRSMQRLGQAWGSDVIESAVLHNDIPTDLVAFRFSKIVELSKTFPIEVNTIWKARMDYLKGDKNDKQQRVA